MADTPARPPAIGVVDDDPARRGALIIRDKVAQRIAAKAAFDTTGVCVHGSGLDRLTGRSSPKVDVVIAANRVRAAVDIAVPWSVALTAVAASVRENVAAALSDLAGLQVDGVDVTVSEVVAADDTAPARRAQ